LDLGTGSVLWTCDWNEPPGPSALTVNQTGAPLQCGRWLPRYHLRGPTRAGSEGGKPRRVVRLEQKAKSAFPGAATVPPPTVLELPPEQRSDDEAQELACDLRVGVGVQDLPHSEVELELEHRSIAASRRGQLNAKRVFALGLDDAPFGSQKAIQVVDERRVAHVDDQCRRRLPGVAATGLRVSVWRDLGSGQ
jgi:hypothetical protein